MDMELVYNEFTSRINNMTDEDWLEKISDLIVDENKKDEVEIILLNMYGIATRNSNGQYRLFSDVFNDVKKVYDILGSKEEKDRLAELLLGERHGYWVQERLLDELEK